MPAIIRPEKWQERPSGPLILDQGHWAFGAIVHALCPGQALIDLKTGIAPTKVDAPEIVGTPEGPATHSSSIYRYYEFADSPQNSNSRLMVVARWAGSGATNEGPASKRVVGGQGWNLAGSFNALLGANYPAFGFFDGSGWRTASGTEDIRSAGLVTLAGGYDGNVVTLSAKGRTYTTAFSGSIPDAAVSVKIGGDGGDVVLGGTTSLFYLIDGNRLRSSTGAVEELAKAPWQVFRKQAKILYFPSAGGGGATLTADSGTYTLTGTAVTLKADRKLAAGSGSYAVTGTDAALKVGRKLSADSGTYSVTGTAVNFLRGYALAAESGSYSVSGTDAALRVGRLLSAASGSYVLSGSAAALQYQPAGSYSLTAESGAYTLTGTAATLKVSRKLTAESGSYSLTGSDATFKRGFSVSAGAGSYTLTGTNVAFARTYVLGAETGAYTLTGSDVGLTWSAAPVVETPTHGGPSIYGKAVFREKEFRREYDEQIRRIDEAKLAERLIREDEELIIIMAALAA